MSIKLRDYQQAAVNDVRDSFRRDKRRTLLVAPCGAGKTVVFSSICAGVAANGKRVLIVAHRKELLRQISSALKMAGVRHAVLAGGYMGIPTANVVVASVFTLANRLDRFPPPDLIIGDEAHHFTPKSTWGRVVEKFPNARVLGVTATPERMDGKGLGLLFDDMVMGPTVAELTEQGFLSPAEVYAPSKPNLTGLHSRGGDYVTSELETAMDKPSITGSAVTHYRKYADGKRAIAFCVSVKHAVDVAEDFRKAGYSAHHVDGGMKDQERDRVLADFGAGKIQVLTTCDLISEGFDVPAVEVAILLRPTKSLGLYIQQVGRAVRIAPGKTKAIILDHAGNTAIHGFIDDPRDWELTDGKARKSKPGESVPAVRTCPECYAMHKPSPICPKCDYVYRVMGRKIEQRDGELVQMTRTDDVKNEAQSKQMSQRFQFLVGIGRKRAYSSPEKWAFNVICGQEAARLAKKRDAFNKPLVNGLTPDERTKIWSETIGKQSS